MTDQKLSAVIPTFNSGSYLDRCVDATTASSDVDDVIVLDAGSTDGSVERITGREGVRVLTLPGTGLTHRMNRGFEEARNDLVLLLNSDAFVDPEAPGLLAHAMAARPQVGAMGAKMRYEDDRPQRSAGQYLTLASETLNVLFLRRLGALMLPGVDPPLSASGVDDRATWVPYCATVVRQSAYRDVGGFDERFSFYRDDQDFSRRLIEAGWKLAVCWDAGAIHVGGGATSQKDPAGWFGRYQENRLIYLQKFYPRGWRVFAVAWTARASGHLLMWSLRAQLRRLRSDLEGERRARDWAAAFKSSIWGLGGIRAKP